MTSREAYVSFLNLANKLNSNDDVNIDTARFVLLYNKNAKLWLEEKVRKDKSNLRIDEIQQMVRENVSLVQVGASIDHLDFKLPDDWFDNIGAYALCSRESCTDRLINGDQVKNEEKRFILFDENWRPDFDFEWLPFTVGEDKIQVYFKDFTVNSFVIDYYRYPSPIDIAGYLKVDGTLSTNIDPDIDDIYVNQIIDLVVRDVSMIYQNQIKTQLDSVRVEENK